MFLFNYPNQFVCLDHLVKNTNQVFAESHIILFISVVSPADFEVDSVKKFPCIKNPDGTHHCLGKTKGRPHPKVDEPVLKRLKRFYEPENDKLYSLIHQNFRWE